MIGHKCIINVIYAAFYLERFVDLKTITKNIDGRGGDSVVMLSHS